MVTMNDVASAAGVSVSTVSHVVNKTRRVNPETERAVMAAIADSGYSNDGIARSLRTGRTHTVGLAMSAISNPYFGDVVHAIERELTAAGYSLLLTDTHDDPERELRAVRELLQRRPDAVIIAPSADPGAAVAQLARRGLPTVLIDRIPTGADSSLAGVALVDAVGVENVESTAMLTCHLAEHGHRRIGFVAGRDGLTTTSERLEGYRLGLHQSGLSFDGALVGHGDSAEDPARTAVTTLLGLADPPSALITGNNQMTIGTMRALREVGVVVPRDLALVSFDDFTWADLFEPRLTAMAQPVDTLGALAVQMLLGRIADPDAAPQRVRLEPEFVRRDSCGC
jgi:LacI family transcriptional regulator